MKRKTTNAMKIMGTTLAVCSAAMLMGTTMSGNNSTKKTMKKTAQKVTEFVDTVSALMQLKQS